MMDYSLLLGVHDCVQAEQENLERRERPERKHYSIVALTYHYFWFQFHPFFCCTEADLAAVAEDSYNEDDEDSCGSTVGVGGAIGPTPPDSPQMNREKVCATRSLSQSYPYQYTGKIVPELDIYAIPCKEGIIKLSTIFYSIVTK